MFQKILIANRGEIAVRIAKACRRMGVATVAVYSEPDRSALHTKVCDEAVAIGPAPSSESYLVQEKIIQAALDTGAEAIHPGYGFLSENADFARAVAKAGLKFIGPSPEAMDAMGDKVSARGHAEAAGVPVAPGTAALADGDDAAAQADSIGYPVMLKASAGGGGIGMRIVRSADDIKEQFESATAQAASAFGVPDVFMEKFIERPRHIEVQILGDEQGNVVHLYERECSIQRRHQKLVEEAPSPALTPEQREDIGARAVALAKRVGYANAGTLEFLYEDGQSTRHPSGDGSKASDEVGRFFFNEMNTRLQVEHPVTEMVTGVDLVEWQLRIASGEELTLRQEDIRLDGHAFEARINAEDPYEDFRPSPGPVGPVRAPAGPGVRFEPGLYAGWTVPGDYDSMVAKLLCHGSDRADAAARMVTALDDMHIQGLTTNQPFHRHLFRHSRFLSGDISTRFLEEEDVLGSDRRERIVAAAVVAAMNQAPGGGLAGAHLRDRIPSVVAARPGRRVREAA